MEPDQDQNQYHFSFFKPSTDSARRNRNMVLQLVLIWAVAIFGFQLLLKILEKPTPEAVYTLYDQSRPALESGQPAVSDMQNACQATLSVLSKIMVKPEYREALDHVLGYYTYRIADSAQASLLGEMLSDFSSVAVSITDIRDAEYLEKKEALYPLLSEIYGLDARDVRIKIAPLELHSALPESLSDENRKLFAEALDLYLVHNQSALTDLKFLGFPFHYFYTAVFLLILFVGLCWLYCVRTDVFNRKYGIEE